MEDLGYGNEELTFEKYKSIMKDRHQDDCRFKNDSDSEEDDSLEKRDQTIKTAKRLNALKMKKRRISRNPQRITMKQGRTFGRKTKPTKGVKL